MAHEISRVRSVENIGFFAGRATLERRRRLAHRREHEFALEFAGLRHRSEPNDLGRSEGILAGFVRGGTMRNASERRSSDPNSYDLTMEYVGEASDQAPGFPLKADR